MVTYETAACILATLLGSAAILWAFARIIMADPLPHQVSNIKSKLLAEEIETLNYLIQPSRNKSVDDRSSKIIDAETRAVLTELVARLS
jgi:hypothetical protein